MNTKMLSIKEELKSTAEEIKVSKREFKDQQKSQRNDWEFLRKLWKLESEINRLKFRFRHKLIAYSLQKGKKYEQIERSVRKGNEPDWNLIKGIQDEITS